MTTSTPHADRTKAPPCHPAPRLKQGGRCAAFTLTELIIASSLGTLVLAGVLSTFLLISRTGFNAATYARMNSELRQAVERFNHDVRLAVDIRWDNEQRLTLLLPADVGPPVTYAYEAAARSGDTGRFIRQPEGAPAQVLVSHVAPDFAFARYRLPDEKTAEPSRANNDLETKQLELRLRAVRPAARTPAISQLATSARCVLRNKSMTQ